VTLQGPCAKVGLVREFRVVRLPADDKDMILSARMLDVELLWTRAAQMLDMSLNVCDFYVDVHQFAQNRFI
jgi:hypothetical protein